MNNNPNEVVINLGADSTTTTSTTKKKTDWGQTATNVGNLLTTIGGIVKPAPNQPSGQQIQVNVPPPPPPPTPWYKKPLVIGALVVGVAAVGFIGYKLVSK